jgi:hypothetical protein
MSPVRYELGFYIPEDDILHGHRCDNLKSYLCKYLSKFCTRRAGGGGCHKKGRGRGLSEYTRHIPGSFLVI